MAEFIVYARVVDGQAKMCDTILRGAARYLHSFIKIDECSLGYRTGCGKTAVWRAVGSVCYSPGLCHLRH